MEHQEIYTQHLIKDKLPEKDGWYNVTMTNEPIVQGTFRVYTKQGGWEFKVLDEYTHWLEHKKNMVVFTEDEHKKYCEELKIAILENAREYLVENTHDYFHTLIEQSKDNINEINENHGTTKE